MMQLSFDFDGPPIWAAAILDDPRRRDPAASIIAIENDQVSIRLGDDVAQCRPTSSSTYDVYIDRQTAAA